MNNKQTNIFLVRHGQTTWNLEKRWQGSKNSNLTDLGIEQAQKAKKYLDTCHVDSAYVSPLQRAQDTMTILLEDKDIEAIILEDIRELNIGPWEGVTQEDTKQTDPEEFHNFWKAPDRFSLKGAETFEDLQNRVVQALNTIFDKHEGCNILLVSHWISIKVALAHFSTTPLSKLPLMSDPLNAQVLCLHKNGKEVSIL
ncbi:MAG: histidine phosphatase family protein [Campylobacteraceae bacterium]|nr:histidine phosphatase family protein [Campylobacteraceae bacterium]